MGKRVLTSSGRVIDLDKGEGVETIPPESLQMEKHSYGAYIPSQSFSVIFNGQTTMLMVGYNQFIDDESGRRRLLTELQEMKLFPKSFPVYLSQNHVNGSIYYTVYMTIKGISHKVIMTYDSDHPNYQINVEIEYPKLSMAKMRGHWYRDGKPCYLHQWNRSWTALKTATQIRFWLEDYYNSRDSGYTDYRNNNSDNPINPNNFHELLEKITRIQGGFFTF
ncbi:MAG TPA: hypothetical protein VJ771_06595 [Candidatus Nitrosotalea sp.]|nr:hypothetical protein [Candidatus Nitrosotalea sp.]